MEGDGCGLLNSPGWMQWKGSQGEIPHPPQAASVLGIEGPTDGATAGGLSPSDGPCSRRPCRGYAWKVGWKQMGHTIPAFCRLSRVVGFVSLLPHLGKSNNFKTGVWGTCFMTLGQVICGFDCKPAWCTTKQEKKPVFLLEIWQTSSANLNFSPFNYS